jgi:uncharacterized membrane protein
MSEEPAADTGVTSDDKLWALLTYALTPVIPIVILLLENKKSRPFIRAHNAQALIWGLITIVVTGLTSFLCGIPGAILWVIGVYWGIKAYGGEYVEIPGITNFVKDQGWA